MRITEAAWFRVPRVLITVVSAWVERVGRVMMAVMGLTELVDVIGSKVFHTPLPGSTEMTAVVQMATIAGGLAFSEIDGRHIRVDLLLEWLPERGKAVLDLFGTILALVFFLIAGWMMYENGLSLLESGTRTLLLRIPLAPFAFWIAFCSLLMCCVLIIKLLASVQRVLK